MMIRCQFCQATIFIQSPLNGIKVGTVICPNCNKAIVNDPFPDMMAKLIGLMEPNPPIPKYIATVLSHRVKLLILNEHDVMFITETIGDVPVGSGVTLYRDELLDLLKLLEAMKPKLEGKM